MTQPQANQYLLDTGYTQLEIDYAFACCAPMVTILSQLDDVQETEPVQESETREIVEQPALSYFERRHKMLEDRNIVEFLGLEDFQ